MLLLQIQPLRIWPSFVPQIHTANIVCIAAIALAHTQTWLACPLLHDLRDCFVFAAQIAQLITRAPDIRTAPWMHVASNSLNESFEGTSNDDCFRWTANFVDSLSISVNMSKRSFPFVSLVSFLFFSGLRIRHVSNGQQIYVRRKGMSFDEKKVTLLAAMQGEALCKIFLSSCENIASKNCCLRSNRTIFKTTTFATTLPFPSHFSP